MGAVEVDGSLLHAGDKFEFLVLVDPAFGAAVAFAGLCVRLADTKLKASIREVHHMPASGADGGGRACGGRDPKS